MAVSSPAGALPADAWTLLRQRLLTRSGSRCEVCGHPVPPRWEAHHRTPRGMGGSRVDRDVVSRLLVAGPLCHLWVEANRYAARARGLLVPQGLDWREVPVVLASGRRVTLDDFGFYGPAPAPAYWPEVALPSEPCLNAALF